MKKIGILVNSMNFGGNERSAANIAKSLNNNFEMCIITQEQNNSIENNELIYNLDVPCKRSFLGKIYNSFVRYFRLRKLIKEKKIDSILVILAVSNVLNYLPLGCKRIVSCRDCGDLIRNTSKYYWMEKLSAGIVFNSKYQKDYFLNRYPKEFHKCSSIYNILDLDGISKKLLDSVEKEFVEFVEGKDSIIAMGRFVEVKGFSNLIKSFYLAQKNNSNMCLVLIGDGVVREKIVELVRELKISEKVMLLGYKQNPFKYIARCSVFALPSYSEGFPNVLLEALACGIPVISTDCPSGPREILDEQCSNLFEHIDAELICKAGILCPNFDKVNEWEASYFSESNKIFARALVSMTCDYKIQDYSKNAKKRALDFVEGRIINEWIKVFK